jgi:hypothetical protein
LASELESKYLKNPSIEELNKFLANDQTDKEYGLGHPFSENVAVNLKRNARNAGYNMCVVIFDVHFAEVRLRGDWFVYSQFPFSLVTSICINGIKLDDGTFIYIWPYTDEIIEDIRDAYPYLEDQTENSHPELFKGVLGDKSFITIRSHRWSHYLPRASYNYIIKEVHIW